MADVRIERAGPGDLDTLVPLFEAYRDFYECDPDEVGARGFLAERLANDESVVFLAYENGGRAVGFSQLYPTFGSLDLAASWVLYDLFVTPNARRGGIGRALLEHSVAFGRDSGAAFMILETASDNVRAKALYESAGWELDTVFDTYEIDLR